MKTVLVILLAFLMVGCANTTVIRVVEYGAGGASGLLTGGAGGCAVHQQKESKPFAEVTIHYKGEKCEVMVTSKP